MTRGRKAMQAAGMATIDALRGWSAHWPSGARITITHLGDACDELADGVCAWGDSAGFDVQFVAQDVRDGMGEVVERLGVGSCDYAVTTGYLHRTPEIEGLTLLRILDRLATKGIVWSDLRRRGVLGWARGKERELGASIADDGFTKLQALEMADRVGIASWTEYSTKLWSPVFTIAGERKGAWNWLG